MDKRAVVSALLGTINDDIALHDYGDGLLADLPLTYSDGDSIRLLLEPMGSGVRVSDQASAYERLMLAGVNTDTPRISEAIKAAIRTSRLNNVGGEEDEIASFGAGEDLGRLVLAVAQATARVEQLRWVAARRPQVRFADRVVERVQRVAREGWRVERNAAVRLRSGRERPVTVSVETSYATAYVQALSAKDRDQAVEHCYYLFSWADVPEGNRLAALDGTPESWPDKLVSELKTVAGVEFFDEGRSLERAVERVLSPAKA